MRLVFAGTPAFAATALDALIAARHEIVMVLTQPDRPSGRGLALHPSAVKVVAADHGIPVLQPGSLRLDGRHASEARAVHDLLHAHAPHVMVVVAYGLLLPPSVLTIPRHGCVNIHASLLPRWRGAAPIQRAIEAGDLETGITIMQMDAGLDTGDILLAKSQVIDAADTAATLTDRLASLGGRAIVEALERLADGRLPARPQLDSDGERLVSYASKLSKTEARADFSLGARSLVDRIRAFDPWPGCNADLTDVASTTTQSFRIWKAEPYRIDPRTTMVERAATPGDVLGFDDATGVTVATGDRPIVITELQKPGGKRLPAGRFARDFDEGRALRFVPPRR